MDLLRVFAFQILSQREKSISNSQHLEKSKFENRTEHITSLTGRGHRLRGGSWRQTRRQWRFRSGTRCGTRAGACAR